MCFSSRHDRTRSRPRLGLGRTTTLPQDRLHCARGWKREAIEDRTSRSSIQNTINRTSQDVTLTTQHVLLPRTTTTTTIRRSQIIQQPPSTCRHHRDRHPHHDRWSCTLMMQCWIFSWSRVSAERPGRGGSQQGFGWDPLAVALARGAGSWLVASDVAKAKLGGRICLYCRLIHEFWTSNIVYLTSATLREEEGAGWRSAAFS